jgi:glucose-6-phosphate 1-epimerase
MGADLKELNDRLGLPGLLFSIGAGGFTRAVIDTPVAKGEVYLHGAHVTGFQPSGHMPVLWMSGSSYFAAGKPIRGGVPICFPWFGPNAKDTQLPAHGFARTSMWEIVGSGRMADGGVAVELATVIDGFSLRYRVEFGKALELSLSVEWDEGASPPSDSAPHPPTPSPQKTGARGGNNSCVNGASRSFEEALHTYLAVGDIRQVSIEGLETYSFLDKVGGVSKREATQEAIRFTEETDRVYLDTNAVCALRDPVLKRSITVHQRNSRSTIVWNPWIDKSARMPDFGDDEWPGMVCIETANVGDQAVEIQPGQQHTMLARVEVSKGL